MHPRSLVALVGVAFLLSGCAIGGTKTTTVTDTRTVTSPAEPTKNLTYFGVPVSVTKLDAKRYALTVTPELFLLGVTANVAFAMRQHLLCQPLDCAPVDNDHLVLAAGSQD